MDLRVVVVGHEELRASAARNCRVCAEMDRFHIRAATVGV